MTCRVENGVVPMGIAFRELSRERSRWRLPQSRDRGLQGSTHCRYCVHGSHLLPTDHCRWVTIAGTLARKRLPYRAVSAVDALAQHREFTASQISALFPATASAISQHLKVLREANLVTMEKRAQQRVYQLNVSTMAGAADWINVRTGMWQARLDRLDEYVQQLNP